MGTEFVFMLIGVLASLRAVFHAAINSDSKLSPMHKSVMDQWKQETSKANDPGSIINVFVKPARDSILKAVDLQAYASKISSVSGEGEAAIYSDESYDLVYYRGRERVELLPKIKEAIDWYEEHLSRMEAQVPDLPESAEDEEDWADIIEALSLS